MLKLDNLEVLDVKTGKSCVNFQISLKSLNLMSKNAQSLKNEGYNINNIYLLMRRIKEEFLEELKIGCHFNNDINDYIEYIIERSREI